MGKLYRKKDGILVISGPVVRTAPAPNGATDVVIATQEYDSQTKQFNNSEWTVRAEQVDSTLAIGSIATAWGYQSSQNGIASKKITVGPAVQTVNETTEIISGPVHKAAYKSETNEDGTPKLKRDGTPRKPHFDVTVVVPDEAGHKVYHSVRIYNFRDSEGPSEIDKAQARFKDFVDKDQTPIEVTIVTSPAAIESWDSEWNGNPYTNYACNHLGKKSWDINRVGVQQPAAPVPTPAPAPTSSPSPMPAPMGGFAPNVPFVEDEDVF